MLKEILHEGNESHLAPLNGVRALSIIFVICFHAFFFSQYAFTEKELFVQFSEGLPWWLSWIRRGDMGVDIFFVLSAFLIGRQLFAEYNRSSRINFRWFYIKRFLRIYPLYIFAIALYILSKKNAGYFWANLLAVNNLIDLKKILIPWSWSLSVEIQFYLICPFLVIMFGKAKYKIFWFTGMLLLSLLWAVAVINNQPDLLNNSMMDILVGDQKRDLGFYYMEHLYVLPQARFPSFYCGLLAAWLWINYQETIIFHLQRNRSVLFIVSVLSLAGGILIASYDVFKPASAFNDFDHIFHGINMVAGRFIFSLLITLLIIISLARVRGGRWVGRFFSLPIFYPIAKVSYSMYLFHPPFLFLSFFLIFGKGKIEMLSVANLLLLAGMGILFSFIFGVITFYLVERRFTSKNIRQHLREKFAT